MPSDRTPHWGFAEHADTPALRRFVCATPPKREWHPQRGKYHPSPWELETQSALRSLRLPVPADEGLVIRSLGGEIVAACHFGYDKKIDQFFVWTLATSVAARRRGFARIALGRAVDVVKATQAEQQSDCALFTRVHPKNLKSRYLFASSGFENLGIVHGEYETWVLMKL